MKKQIKPLVKWTGGKYSEFSKFSAYIPVFERYFEPFFGGGGVFFALQPISNAFVNDKSADLISFYKNLLNERYKKELLDLVESWEGLSVLNALFQKVIHKDFTAYLQNAADKDLLIDKVDRFFSTLDPHVIQTVFTFDIIQPADLLSFIKNSVKDKFNRIKRISNKDHRLFDQHDIAHHVETSLRSGFYLYLRSLLNTAERSGYSTEAKSAAWYFVREFCYASMFRFNAKGKFNIPYGGIAYNKKNFRAKVNSLFTLEVAQVFKDCVLSNEDFERFLSSYPAGEKDFIFLDPPYDSEFSEYDQNAFTRQDQIRLRDCLGHQKAKWMMVIKETAFIRAIYEEIGAYMMDFDKTYTYNVRGRNNRDTKHLVITNYKIS